MKDQDVVIIGAGPYGLSTAANLQASGMEPYVIGRPMSFWKESMPRGMILRSEIEASNIYAPQKHLSLLGFEKATGRHVHEPIPIDDFIAYGDWFQKQVAPNLDTRLVKNLARNGNSFEVTFEGGEQLHARSIVLALGIGSFTYRPEQFGSIPNDLAFHSSELRNPSELAGKRVAVIGKGQSALESAALLHEIGVEVQLLTRAPGLNYLKYPWRRKWLRKVTPGPLTPFSYKLFPPTDLGGIITSRTIADPEKFRRRSPRVQEYLARSVTRPIGAYWLPPRIAPIRVRTNVTVSRVEVVNHDVRLTLSDGNTTQVDRVVLGTGYRIDVSRWAILDPSLRREIQILPDGYPALTTGLETSVKGLHLAGVIGEKTLGPTLRFVTGTSNASPRIAAAIAARRR